MYESSTLCVLAILCSSAYSTHVAGVRVCSAANPRRNSTVCSSAVRGSMSLLDVHHASWALVRRARARRGAWCARADGGGAWWADDEEERRGEGGCTSGVRAPPRARRRCAQPCAFTWNAHRPREGERSSDMCSCVFGGVFVGCAKQLRLGIDLDERVRLLDDKKRGLARVGREREGKGRRGGEGGGGKERKRRRGHPAGTDFPY